MSQSNRGPVRPATGVRAFTAADLTGLSARAAAADRRRANLNVHAALDAGVQRLFIATEPDSYMRPHRHPEPHKWEFFVALRGRIDLLVFAADGEVSLRVPMAADATTAVEVPPGMFHSYVCMQPGTVALEIKEGAYIPTAGADFAPWSPAEHSAGVPAFLEWLRGARPGSRP